MKVLVTGGTGAIGRPLVSELRARGAKVLVLSRRPPQQAGVTAGGFVQGDLNTGAGLAAAVAGVDVIVHCASATDYRRPERDVEQTRKLLAAVGDARPHLLYISIVGVDKIQFGYYRAKLATERLIESSGLPWTIQRTTQFHDLVLMFLLLASKSPIVLVPRGFRAQPVDVRDVAERMATLALGKPAGRVPDLGGPQVESLAELTRWYLRLRGKRRLVLPVPVPGRVAAEFRAGGHLLGEAGVCGKRTFADYLRDQIRPDRAIQPPYQLKGRFRR